MVYYKRQKMWNELKLCAPHGDFSSYNLQDANIFEDLSKVVAVLTRAAHQIRKNHPSCEEIELFHMLRSRLALKLPCDKFLHLFHRIGCCLKHFVQINLSKSYLDLAEIFLSAISSGTSFSSAKLPSRQQLEFLLIRTQGTAKLACQILNYCEATFLHLLQRLSVGHMTHCLLMAASVVARVRFTFKALLVQLGDLHRKVKPLCNLLQLGTWQWPCDPDIPEDLWTWLDPGGSIRKSQNIETSDQFGFLHLMFKPNVDNIKDTFESKFDPFDPAICDVGEVQSRNEGPEESASDSQIIGRPAIAEERGLDIVQEKLTSQVKQQRNRKQNSSLSLNPRTLQKVIRKAKTLKSLTLVARIMLRECRSKASVDSHRKNVITVKHVIQKLKLSIKRLKKLETSSAKKACRKRLIENAKREFMYHLGLNSKSMIIPYEDASENLSDKSQYKSVQSLAKLLDLFYHFNGRTKVKQDAKLGKSLARCFIQCYEDAKMLRASQQCLLSKKLISQTSRKMIAMCVGE